MRAKCERSFFEPKATAGRLRKAGLDRDYPGAETELMTRSPITKRDGASMQSGSIVRLSMATLTAKTSVVSVMRATVYNTTRVLNCSSRGINQHRHRRPFSLTARGYESGRRCFAPDYIDTSPSRAHAANLDGLKAVVIHEFNMLAGKEVRAVEDRMEILVTSKRITKTFKRIVISTDGIIRSTCQLKSQFATCC